MSVDGDCAGKCTKPTDSPASDAFGACFKQQLEDGQAACAEQCDSAGSAASSSTGAAPGINCSTADDPAFCLCSVSSSNASTAPSDSGPVYDLALLRW